MYPFISLLSLKEPHTRDFGAQVLAIRAGCAEVAKATYSYIGNLDADVSFGPMYFAELLDRFASDPQLGLAGGFIYEKNRRDFRSRKGNRVHSVPHAVQLFRRECFEAIGGYVPLRYGGPDWHAELLSRMNGWHVRSFPELHVCHHRRTGSAEGWFRGAVRQGHMDYSFGSLPLFEVLKCVARFSRWPVCIAPLIRLLAFAWSCSSFEPRQVSQKTVEFLRKEQKLRLRSLLKDALKGETKEMF